jgi:ubiquinone/menaquinone biosynthesis C-methylase UbiE
MTAASEPKARYVHGYATEEQRRLIAQAEFWRERLILDGTAIAPYERVLEIGCGAGAVLGVLGTAFPAAWFSGVDISPEQVAFARSHLAELEVAADLRVAAGQALPFADSSFDHVWSMWLLEHMATAADAVSVLKEARRVLVPGGTLTSIEADYSTLGVAPASPELEKLRAAMVRTFDAFGSAHAGTQLPGWLVEAEYTEIRSGERLYSHRGAETGPVTRYIADAVEPMIPVMVTVPGNPDERTLRAGITQLRDLASAPAARVHYVIHKAQAKA